MISEAETMTDQKRPIFRRKALKAYRDGREKAILPRFSGATNVLGNLADRIRPRRIPVLLQLTPVECGAACLAMILGYHGRATRVSDVRARCDVGRDGVTARTLVEAARSYGLRAKGYSVEPDDFNYVPLPAVAHWKFNHYVVVERWSPETVTIIDPGYGRRAITAAEFDASLTGVVLTLEPGVHFNRGRASRLSSWRHALSAIAHSGHFWGPMSLILGASLLLQLLGLAVPIFTRVVVDQILPNGSEEPLTLLGLGIAALLLAQGLFVLMRGALLVQLQGRLDAGLMLGFFEHVLSLPYRYFQQRSSGDLLMRLGSNMVIRETLTSQTISVILDGVFVLVYLAIMLFQAPALGLLALGIGTLQILLLLATTRRVHDLTQRDLVAQADSRAFLVEALAGVAALKAAGSEDRALGHWSGLFYKHLNVTLERNRLSARIDAIMTTLRTLAPLALLWVGAQLVLNGGMSLGTMLGSSALAIAFLTPLASLVESGRELQLVGAHLERMADVFEAEPEQAPEEVQIAPQLSGHIELQGVSFRYDTHAPLVLRDISLTVEPGQKVAIVGRTGSGKSTLGMLLLGLYQPAAGEIRYDGIPLQELDYRSLRSQYGVVLQESFLFSGSVRENISFNQPDLSMEAVIDAAKAAEIHEDVSQMPMGYETLVAEGGSGLSGGQRQRLALARALAHHPTILLLDEATSQLDVATEAMVERNLNMLSNTRIVIAHRLSTVRSADQIFVLDEGVIVEQGTHEELLAVSGHYASLIHGQSGERQMAGPVKIAEGE